MTLPFDISRCHPAAQDDLCRDCARWAGHPDQTWGERTPANTAVVRSVSCNFTPLPTKVTSPCGCHACQPITWENMRMILCELCGNKRCPHANDHRNACTKSNDVGQHGSAYP